MQSSAYHVKGKIESIDLDNLEDDIQVSWV